MQVVESEGFPAPPPRSPAGGAAYLSWAARASSRLGKAPSQAESGAAGIASAISASSTKAHNLSSSSCRKSSAWSSGTGRRSDTAAGPSSAAATTPQEYPPLPLEGGPLKREGTVTADIGGRY